ncbi:Oidioi.mRNA.OKI2018_I69.PAR.g10223.t2.cds [Oikopleura dioica]|uniref:Oidioi.mRNA.OKI2018_I69.PAR.g10223.t2.cds n=1 Tax=Oikopleura dioica TaxID=34765 RepID=A0ABN7RTW0_OIKDI|nr:Oidioi.mRNA.OKI2018_I69.PAR.g10223.t2.cds [Oikopleura dioica]
MFFIGAAIIGCSVILVIKFWPTKEQVREPEPEEDSNFTNPNSKNPGFKPIFSFTENQEKLYDNFYANLNSSAEINAYVDGTRWPAVMSSTRLTYEEAKGFCAYRNSSLLRRTTSMISPIPEFIRQSRYKYWIYAEYTSDYQIIDMNKDIRRKIENELEAAKERKDFVYVCRDCKQFANESLPRDCLNNHVDDDVAKFSTFEFICETQVFEDEKILIQINKTINCKLLKLNSSFLDEYGLWKTDKIDQLEGKKWKLTSKKTSMKELILSGYLTADMPKDDLSEEIGIPWCPNNPNRLQGAYFYNGNVHTGRVHGSRAYAICLLEKTN